MGNVLFLPIAIGGRSGMIRLDERVAWEKRPHFSVVIIHGVGM